MNIASIHDKHRTNNDSYTGNGIFTGGLRQAIAALEQREEGVHPRDFKFIFNNVKWSPGALEQEILEGRWDVVKMPPEMVLEQLDVGGCQHE